MSSHVWILIAWVVTGAALLVVHAAALWQGMRRLQGQSWRWIALLPPATPYVAWKAGARVAPFLWVLLLTIYLVLRVVGA